MPKKILIIDDDPVQIKIFSNGLEKHNYTVAINNNGKHVPEQLEKENPDIILLDILFPDTSGLEIAKYLYEENFPYIFISSSDDQSVLNKAYKLGALGFLLKPINIKQLVVEIETALHWHGEKIQLNRRKENINSTIDNNRKISVAIGIIMERYNTEGAEAFESIRCAARSKQCRILDIAIRLVEAHEKDARDMQKGRNENTILSTDHILDKILETIRE